MFTVFNLRKIEKKTTSVYGLYMTDIPDNHTLELEIYSNFLKVHITQAEGLRPYRKQRMSRKHCARHVDASLFIQNIKHGISNY